MPEAKPTIVRQPVPLQLHRRVHAELVARHNEGFLEGVCDALDVVKALGFHEAYDAAIAAMFTKAEGGHG